MASIHLKMQKGKSTDHGLATLDTCDGLDGRVILYALGIGIWTCDCICVGYRRMDV